MHGKSKWAALALAGLLLAGCGGGAWRDALLGRRNDLVPLDNATLGRTSRDEILQRFGAPDEIDGRRFDGRDSEVFFYYEEGFEGDGPAAGLRAQILACEFERGVLRGYVFQTLRADPAPAVDERTRSRLVRGTTTRAEAESLLGRPQGRSLLPTSLTLHALAGGQLGGVPVALAGGIPEGAGEAWLYHTQALEEGGRKSRQDSLIVFFDGKGIYLGNTWLQQWVSKAP